MFMGRSRKNIERDLEKRMMVWFCTPSDSSSAIEQASMTEFFGSHCLLVPPMIESEGRRRRGVGGVEGNRTLSRQSDPGGREGPSLPWLHNPLKWAPQREKMELACGGVERSGAARPPGPRPKDIPEITQGTCREETGHAMRCSLSY